VTSEGVVLSGLDGTNPLGFLAALGLLRILDEHAVERRSARPRLFWTDEGSWYPAIDGAGGIDAILDGVTGDLATWSDDPALLLAYTDDHLADPRTDPKATRDLKPPPALMRAFLQSIAAMSQTHVESEPSWRMRRRSMDTASALGSEMITDNNGRTKPFALHFTAGQQQFLKAIAEIRPVPAEIAALTIGETAFLFLPGEPFVETGLTIRRQSPFRILFSVGYAGSTVGYIPTNQAFDEGGYEIGPGKWSYLACGCELMLRRSAIALLMQMNRVSRI